MSARAGPCFQRPSERSANGRPIANFVRARPSTPWQPAHFRFQTRSPGSEGPQAAGRIARRATASRSCFSARRDAVLSLAAMANKDDKHPDNVGGKFYVDTQCIDCDVCRVTAPSNFTRQEEKGYSYVSKQPETPEEEAQCQEALDSCPVEAIGKDGE